MTRRFSTLHSDFSRLHGNWCSAGVMLSAVPAELRGALNEKPNLAIIGSFERVQGFEVFRVRLDGKQPIESGWCRLKNAPR